MYKNIAFYKRKREALLKKIAKTGYLLGGSLVLAGRVCGYPNCACAKGKKHPTYYLTWAHKKKTQTLYVPLDLLDEVKAAVEQHKRLKLLMDQMNKLQREIIRRYVKEKRGRAKHKKKQSKSK